MIKRKEYEQSRLKMLNALPDILLNQKSEELVLNDFVEYVGISKNTFYNHYRGLFELYSDYCLWVENNESKLIDELLSHKELERIVFRGVERVINDKFFRCYILLKPDIEITIQRELKKINPILKSNQALTEFVSYGTIGIIKKWLTDGNKEDKQTIIDEILSIYYRLLGKTFFAIN